MKTKRKPVNLPDDQRERLNRAQFTGMMMMLAFLSIAAYWLEDLDARLKWKCIKRGKWRAAAAVGLLRSICDDLLGTAPRTQTKQIYGTMKDYEVRIVPKATPGTTNIIMQRDVAVALMNIARSKCADCVEDGHTCRKCELYKILEATTPLDDYGDGLICPYSLAQWE